MIAASEIKLKNITIANHLPFTLIAGPCQMQSRDHALMTAEKIKIITDKLNIPVIYKTSFDKANRTSLKTERGLGIEKALPIFQEIKDQFNMPVLTDVHDANQCDTLKDVIDVLQIPAFLCRQTDLVVAAAQSGCVLNIKKGQFLAPWDMKNVIAKAVDSGNKNVMACDRGTSFGYNTLVSDMRGLDIMKRECGVVIFDATHSVQQPGGQGGTSGGQREFVEILARAAFAVGVGGVFIETHEDPDNAPSDGPNMVPLNQLEKLLRRLQMIDTVVKDTNF
ncbi:MAG: 2-dehydro-3-deoxyphosphooctonate aldolase (KDO 8-P synthase) [Alphaproteobacteria bacterium]|jgi:2-dehydro-3-deoxyphosphooctonate aldolase (KDO 8-P synthase)